MDGQLHAIVVGNEHYAGLPDVAYAIADAEAVQELLVSADLNPVSPELVTVLTDVTLDEFGSKLHEAFEPVQRNDSVIIYYAGHGLCVGRTGYLLPVEYGAKADLTPNPHTSAFSFRAISEELNSHKPRHFVLLLDSCHSGASFSGLDLVSRGHDDDSVREATAQQTRDVVQLSAQAAFEDESSSRIVLAACAAEEQARGVRELEHGVFTKFLLDGLSGHACDLEGRVDVDSLYQFLHSEVTNYARRHRFHQMPCKSGELKGPCYLPSRVPRFDLSEQPDLAELLERAREKVESEQYDNALELIAEGLEDFPTSYELKKLQREVVQAEREARRREAAERRQQIQRQLEMLWQDAEQFAQEASYEEAIAALVEAEKLDKSGVSTAKREAMEKRSSRAGREVAAQLQALFEEADQLLENDPARALELFRQALSVYPDNERAERGATACEARIARNREADVVHNLLADAEALQAELAGTFDQMKSDIDLYEDLAMKQEAAETLDDLAVQEKRHELVSTEVEWLTTYANVVDEAQTIDQIRDALPAASCKGMPDSLRVHPEGRLLWPAECCEEKEKERKARAVQKAREQKIREKQKLQSTLIIGCIISAFVIFGFVFLLMLIAAASSAHQ